MLLPETEVNFSAVRSFAGSFDITGCETPDVSLLLFITTFGVTGRKKKLTCLRRAAKVYTDRCAHAALKTAEVGPVENAVSHRGEESLEVGTTKVGAGLELRERVHLGADAVEHDVLRRVHVELLRQICVDLEELDARRAGDAGRLVGLFFEGGEQCLEPLKGAHVLAHPDELDSAETGRRVRGVAQMPDVLENRSPRGDSDTSADQDSNLVLEHIFCRGTVGTVDPKRGHLLAVL